MAARLEKEALMPEKIELVLEQVLNSLPPEEKMQHKAKQLAARVKFLKQSGELPAQAEVEGGGSGGGW